MLRSGSFNLDEDSPAELASDEIPIDGAPVVGRELDEEPLPQPAAVDAKKGSTAFNLYFLDERRLLMRSLRFDLYMNVQPDDADPALRDVLLAFREKRTAKVNGSLLG